MPRAAALAPTVIRRPVAARALQCDAPAHGRAPEVHAQVSDEAACHRKLLAALADGDRDALAGLYDRFAPQMLGLALRILRNRRDAEDLVHDVFIEAWQKARSYDRSRGSVHAWLLLRLRSRAIDRARSLAAARQWAMAQAASPPPPTAPEQGDAPDRARARKALETLPREQRACVELAYYEGLSCRDMAARLGIPVGTVKSRLFAAMRSLRVELGVGEDV